MPKTGNQKMKMLYLIKILTEYTDDGHELSVEQIRTKLGEYGISADRKTLYLDFEELRNFGVDIIAQQHDRNVYYHVGKRRFELPELKLLVDSVQSAKFLSERKSRDLIRKIESLGSRYDAKHLQRQVLITGRIKSMNESIYYNVDILHEAINAGKQIQFHYYQWNIDKKAVPRKDNAWYQASPWGLMWDDENYYLIAFDAEERKIKHYRVDKMLHLSITELDREGEDEYAKFNLPKYTKALFGMYGGDTTKVTLEGENDLVGVVIDRFGKDIPIRRKDEDHFLADVNVAISRQFFGWVFAIGNGLKIVAPENVVESMRTEANNLMEIYQ